VELIQELTEENMAQHRHDEAFSAMVDSGLLPISSKTKKGIFARIFGW